MSLPSQSCWSDPLLYRYLFWKAEKVGLLFSNPKSCQYFSFCFLWNKCYIKSHQGRKKRKRKSNPLIIKRHIVPFSVFSQATSVNMIPLFLSKLTDTEKKKKRVQTRERKNKEHFRKKKKTSTTNTVAVVVKICGLREEGKKENTDSYRSGGFPGAGSS